MASAAECKGPGRVQPLAFSVAASAKVFRRRGDIHLPLAAQAHTDALIRQFAEERGNFHSRDTYGVIHDAFAVFFCRAGANHVLVVTHIQANRPSRFRLESAAPSSSILEVGLLK